jgi:asparagine synthase (glutamine-hydrolysing)
MWAFAIWDEIEKTLFLARDRFGIKPLYWGKDSDGALYFSSEMKALADQCKTFSTFPPGHYYTPETGFVKYYQPIWEDAS